MSRLWTPCLRRLAGLLLCCSLCICLYRYTNEQFNLIRDYLALTQRLVNTSVTATLRDKQQCHDLYESLSSDSINQLNEQIVELSHIVDISVAIRCYSQVQILDLAQHGELASMRHLAKKQDGNAQYWHNQLLQVDYDYIWKHARFLSESAQSNSAVTHKQYTNALSVLLSEQRLDVEFKTQKINELTNELVKHALLKKIPQWQQILSQYSTPTSQNWRYLYENHYFDDFARFTEQKALMTNDGSVANCAKPLLLVAQTPWDLMQLDLLTQKFLRSELSQGFCINQQIWLGDMNNLEGNMQNLPALYMLVMHDVDKAYRYKQQINLPPTADLKLMQHEVGHWLGLEDEYALRDELANSRCEAMGKQNVWAMGHNIVAIRDETVFKSVNHAYTSLAHHMAWITHIDDFKAFLVKSEQGWKIKHIDKNTEKVGIYPSETCKNVNGITAYKPLFSLSFMYNYELPIPKLYKEIIISDG